MSTPGILLAALVVLALAYVLLPVVGETFLRLRPARRLQCPESGGNAEVGVDAGWAAFTAAFRHPLLRVSRCSLWPERRGCGQRCLGRSA